MAFDFDRVIERRGTHSTKWDAMGARFGLDAPDQIPMWVADMDFACPPAVGEALRERCDHGIMGYFGADGSVREALIDWLGVRHGWTPEPDWITWNHGLVAGIGFSISAFTEPGDGVVVFSPVYHVFGNTVRASDRVLIESELQTVQGRYQMDLEGLAKTLPDNARMVLLCSPHNPGGRVWTAAELQALCAFCIERDLILVSDEIHYDLVYSGANHTITAKAMPDVMDRLVTLVAPTKTFNLAGALTGAVIISNPEMRKTYAAAKAAVGSSTSNGLGMIAVEAAWRHGHDWLDALLVYLEANRDHFDSVISAGIPGARSMPLEATYLAWVNFADTGLSPARVTEMVERDARIAVNKGPTFGKGGETLLRFNFACPRKTLDTALDRLVDVFATA